MASTSVRFLKMQVGRQSAHGTAVTPTIQIPVVGDYTDERKIYSAQFDAGTWTETEISSINAYLSSLKCTGEGFFEMLPIWLSAAFENVTPSGTYIHDYAISPAAVAAPKPLTALLGAVGTNIGGTGPAVKIKDCYVSQIVLSGNVTSENKEVTTEVSLFGGEVDDNSGAGYAFAEVNMLPNLQPMKALLGGLNIDDAGTTGGVFTTMTAFTGSLLDWKLTINPGIAPLWSGEDNDLNFIGLKYSQPVITFTPTIRTSATNYALVKAKYNARTYQELELTINGTSASFVAQLTGRWTMCPSGHARNNDEVVMQPTFTAKTPYTQTTTPHYAEFINTSANNWNGA